MSFKYFSGSTSLAAFSVAHFRSNFQRGAAIGPAVLLSSSTDCSQQLDGDWADRQEEGDAQAAQHMACTTEGYSRHRKHLRERKKIRGSNIGNTTAQIAERKQCVNLCNTISNILVYTVQHTEYVIVTGWIWRNTANKSQKEFCPKIVKLRTAGDQQSIFFTGIWSSWLYPRSGGGGRGWGCHVLYSHRDYLPANLTACIQMAAISAGWKINLSMQWEVTKLQNCMAVWLVHITCSWVTK